MCFECSVAIKCELLKTLKSNIQNFQIEIEIKIVKCLNSSKFNLKFLHPANAASPFGNWHFLSHRPPIFHKKLIPIQLVLKFLGPCKRCFHLWKLSFSVASSPYFCVPAKAVSYFENCHSLSHRPPIISPRSPLTMRRPPLLGSAHRGILCVEKIGSVVPELQEWPGTPSKPVKSTNGPFYWLTRKRAPPCGGTPAGDPCKNWLPARIGGWPGTATGGQIHVVHISHTHAPKEIIQAPRRYLLGKRPSF